MRAKSDLCRAALAALALSAGAALASDDFTPVSVNPEGALGDGRSANPRLSGDGRLVAFQSDSRNLLPVDTTGVTNVFVRDRSLGVTSLVSLNVNPAAGILADGPSVRPDISADGRYVVFQSDATTLLPGDFNGASDIYVMDRHTGALERVSRGLYGVEANGPSSFPAISADGRHIVYQSDATNLVPADTNGASDVFRYDRATGRTTLVSAVGGRPADGPSARPAIS